MSSCTSGESPTALKLWISPALMTKISPALASKVLPVTLERRRLNEKDELFLYRAKTGNPVCVPLPPEEFRRVRLRIRGTSLG